MKRSELQSIIREEIGKVMSEAVRVPIAGSDTAAVKQIKGQINTFLKNMISAGSMTNQQVNALVDMLGVYEAAIADMVAGEE